MTSPRRRPLLRSRSSAAPPLDDDDLLSEILLRLPPLPSSLPRASAVCKRWRSLASDPAFSRRFRLHHRRNPPLLGCFRGETGVWGTLFSTPMPSGNSLHTRTESLAVIPLPADKSYDAGLNSPEGRFTVMRAEGGGLGLLSVSGFTAQLWKRKTDFDDVASWGMGRTVELDELLSMDSKDYLDIEGYAEDNNLVFLWTGRSLFTVKFEPLQCKKLFDTNNRRCYYPFETVYAAG
ncbi:uncharacterized protein [Aegilops tauschii subsp. strangulata]|uniref:uncharacterized protein n=1 Tax=Aegilops tauschii subsp. strangulata TaxID=200361 RepID=UPI003CC8A977